MARPIEQELYRSVIESQLDFIERDVIHIEEIYDVVKAHFHDLCDDDYMCSEHCSHGNNQPEWNHTVRGAMQQLKKAGIIRRFGIPKFWEFT